MLLPIDLLVRIADGDANLPGLTPDAYHLRSGERLNEAASRAWTQCKAAWDAYRRKWQTLSASDNGTTLTRNEWLLPLFQELGYGRLQPKPAVVIDEKTYPVSHRWEEHVPVHLLSARYSLDKRYPGVEGAATRSPYSMVQELLNRTGKFRWGMVSNGLKLYLLRDNNSLSRAANVEFDLECMMDGEVYADFMLLWLLCHESRVEILSTGVRDQGSGARENAETQGSGKKGKGKGKTAKSASRKTQRALIDDDGDSVSESDDEQSFDEDTDPSDEVATSAISPDPRALTADPSSCWLERWTKEAETRGTRAREKLRSGVENAINALGAGFLETRGNEDLKHRLATGALDKQDFYRQLLRMVYRLLLLLVAEEKKDEHGQNLLHPLGTPGSVRQRYAKYYSVGRLRDLAGLRRGTSHTDLFESLKVLFEKLREGYEPLGIPGLGSFLFSTTATPELDHSHLSNVAVLDCFRQLGYTDDDSKSRRLVDFGNLGSEELGSVYESLLELHPKINSDKGPFILDSAAGSERKTTGSYYTPTSLINCLLDSALDPVIEAAIKGEGSGTGDQGSGKTQRVASATKPSSAIPSDPRPLTPDPSSAEQRLLALKICDPACGSGHFLIAAAERLALHLARIRTGDDQPSSMDVQHAKRDVIGRCIYGVDLNPMAVELCKVSLWMEALDPGRPLSFLDHHIQCGNSLLGTTPALLEQGIPDDAFKPIEGDVNEVASELKRQNKKERSDREKGQGRFEFEPYIKLGNLPGEFTRLSSSRDESVADIAEKERRYAELVSGADYQNARLLADTWCAVFVWKKDASDLGKLCPTENDFRRIENNPHSVLPHVKSQVRHLADQYKFFHWHLAFPDVFRLPGDAGKAENEQMGWNAGFDIVLGNPPWDRLKLDTTEWFAHRRSDIANEGDSNRRKQLIKDLEQQDPGLFAEFKSAANHFAGTCNLLRDSGFLVHGIGGEADLSTAFADLETLLISASGRVGVITSGTTLTGKSSIPLLNHWMRWQRLERAWEFINTKKLFQIDSRQRYALLTITAKNASPSAAVAFELTEPSEIPRLSDALVYTDDEIKLLSPNTAQFPKIQDRKTKQLLVQITQNGSPLESKEQNPFGFITAFIFEENKSRKFFSNEPSTARVSVLEGKSFHQFDHRFANFDNCSPAELQSKSAKEVSASHHACADYEGSRGPRLFADISETNRRWEAKFSRQFAFAAREVSNSTNERTVICSIMPRYAVLHSAWIFDFQKLTPCAACWVFSNFNSFAFDYTARQKVTTSHLSKYVWTQLPVIDPASIDRATIDWHIQRILELTYTAWDLQGFALDCGYDGPPFRWDEERRFLLRCELDAAYFHLYLGSPQEWGRLPEVVSGAEGQVSGKGDSPEPRPLTTDPSSPLLEMFPTPRDAVAYIMETFPIVKRKDIKRTTITDENGLVTQPGTYITKDTILAIYDEMQTAITTGHPYQTRLDPHPGPPVDADGNFTTMAQWDAAYWPSHIHQPRTDGPK